MTDPYRITDEPTPPAAAPADPAASRPKALRIVLWTALVVGVAGTGVASGLPVSGGLHLGLDLGFSALTLAAVLVLVLLKVRGR